MDEKKMAEIIRAALEQYYETEEEGSIRIQSFDDEGIMSNNEGLVIRIENGSKSQVMLVECRRAIWIGSLPKENVNDATKT